MLDYGVLIVLVGSFIFCCLKLILWFIIVCFGCTFDVLLYVVLIEICCLWCWLCGFVVTCGVVYLCFCCFIVSCLGLF